MSNEDIKVELLGWMQALELKPDDVVVFTCHQMLTEQAKQNIKNSWERLGLPNRCIVLDCGMQIGVVRAEAVRDEKGCDSV